MGKLLEYARGITGEKSLWSRMGRWIVEVSKTVDGLVSGTGNVQSLQLPEQSSVPAAVPNTGTVFTQDVNGITELFFLEDNGNTVQLSSNGLLASAVAIAWAAVPAIAASPDNAFVNVRQ